MTVTTANVVQIIDGKPLFSEVAIEDLMPWMAARGHAFTGSHKSPTTRPQLQGQPKFSGFCGPMWDGGPIRYECPEAYAYFSA